jgi:hypothetical protein
LILPILSVPDRTCREGVNRLLFQLNFIQLY